MIVVIHLEVGHVIRWLTRLRRDLLGVDDRIDVVDAPPKVYGWIRAICGVATARDVIRSQARPLAACGLDSSQGG